MKKLLVLILLVVSSLQGLSVSSAQVSISFDNLEHPAFAVASYYNAINRGEYTRAYNYWQGNPPGGATLDAFTRGFSNTASVWALVRLPLRYGVAAGSSYAGMPIILVSTLKNGGQQIFAGCFTVRKSNVPVGNATQPDPNWYLYNAELKEVNRVDFQLAVADNQCTGVESFPEANPSYITTHPIDTLTAYYDAIAKADFQRAYNIWGGNNTSQTLQQFTQGFSGTANIGVVVDLDFLVEGAAGSSFAQVPVLLTATSNNTPQVFAGCYVFRRSNVPVGAAAQPDPNWYLYTVGNTAAKDVAEGLRLLDGACAG
jgi:hypothetical protein